MASSCKCGVSHDYSDIKIDPYDGHSLLDFVLDHQLSGARSLVAAAAEKFEVILKEEAKNHGAKSEGPEFKLWVHAQLCAITQFVPTLNMCFRKFAVEDIEPTEAAVHANWVNHAMFHCRDNTPRCIFDPALPKEALLAVVGGSMAHLNAIAQDKPRIFPGDVREKLAIDLSQLEFNLSKIAAVNGLPTQRHAFQLVMLKIRELCSNSRGQTHAELQAKAEAIVKALHEAPKAEAKADEEKPKAEEKTSEEKPRSGEGKKPDPEGYVRASILWVQQTFKGALRGTMIIGKLTSTFKTATEASFDIVANAVDDDSGTDEEKEKRASEAAKKFIESLPR